MFGNDCRCSNFAFEHHSDHCFLIGRTSIAFDWLAVHCFTIFGKAMVCEIYSMPNPICIKMSLFRFVYRWEWMWSTPFGWVICTKEEFSAWKWNSKQNPSDLTDLGENLEVCGTIYAISCDWKHRFGIQNFIFCIVWLCFQDVKQDIFFLKRIRHLMITKWCNPILVYAIHKRHFVRDSILVTV